MTSHSGKELEAAAKPQGAMPGFDIDYQVADTDVNSGTHAVEAHVNQQKLAAAKAQNASHKNARFATKPAVPNASKSLTSAQAANKGIREKYLGLIAKRFGKKAETIQAKTTPSARAPKTGNAAKEQMEKRLYERTKKALEDTPAKKTVELNPSQLPQTTQDAMKAADMRKKGGPSLGGVAHAVGHVAKSFADWDKVGALMGGSYIDLAMRLKRK